MRVVYSHIKDGSGARIGSGRMDMNRWHLIWIVPLAIGIITLVALTLLAGIEYIFEFEDTAPDYIWMQTWIIIIFAWVFSLNTRGSCSCRCK